MPNTTIALDAAQLVRLARACDLFGRMRMGQLGELVRHHPYELLRLPEGARADGNAWAAYHAWADRLRWAGQAVHGLGPNASWGIAHPEVGRDGHLAYELGRTLDHLRYVARRGSGEDWCVFSTPALTTTTLSFPTLAPGYPADDAGAATLTARVDHVRAGAVACFVAALVAQGDLPNAARSAYGHLDAEHCARIADALNDVPAPTYSRTWPPAADRNADSAAYGALGLTLSHAAGDRA